MSRRQRDPGKLTLFDACGMAPGVVAAAALLALRGVDLALRRR